MRHLLTIFVLTFVATSGAEPASAGETMESVDVPVNNRSRFGDDFDLERLSDHLQGTWVEYYGAPGSRNVWHIEGDHFELYTRDLDTGEIEHKTMKLELFAPCTVYLVQEWNQDGNTGRSAQSLKVAIGEEKSYASTAVGVETSDGAFACTGQEYYELDDSGCTEWKWDRMNDQWESSSAQCSRSEDELVVGDTTLERVGDIYTENADERYRLKRFDSVDEARSEMEQ